MQFEDIISLVSNDFLGYLKNKSLKVKKVQVLRIYRYFYRFSIDMMMSFVNDAILIVITLQYLKDTKLARAH